MIYHGAAQSVASPCSILTDVALLRRKWGEKRCSSQEECCSTHAVCVAAARRARRSARGTSSVVNSAIVARFTYWQCLSVRYDRSIPGKAVHASVLLNASWSKSTSTLSRQYLSRVCARTERRFVGAGLLHASADAVGAEIYCVTPEPNSANQFESKCQMDGIPITQIPTLSRSSNP